MSLAQDVAFPSLRELPNLKLYAVVLIALFLKMQWVGWATTQARKRSKTFVNAEDVRGPTKAIATQESPETERAIRAHRNDMENIYPFLFIALTSILLGCHATTVAVCMVVFVAMRCVHSVAYLRAAQPWRSASYTLGLGTNFVLIGLIISRILR